MSDSVTNPVSGESVSDATLPPEQPVNPPPQKESRRTIFLVGLGIVGAACLLLAVCGLFFGRTIIQVGAEKPHIEETITNFMQAMKNKQTDTALGLFSSRARQQMNVQDLGKMLQGNNYVLFEGFQSAQADNVMLRTGFNTDPNAPQGNTAQVTGQVMYEGKIVGHFDAILEKDGADWKLFHMNVTVPPDKVNH